MILGFSLTKSGFAWGADLNDYSGVMVSINAPKSSLQAYDKIDYGVYGGIQENPKNIVKAKVLIDDQPVGVVSAGKPKALYLSPYHKYNIKIQPLGDSLYDYDQGARKVVVYEGNIIPLTWNFTHEKILFANIKTKIKGKWQPLTRALLISNNQFDRTDTAGYIQSSILSDQKDLVFCLRGF